MSKIETPTAPPPDIKTQVKGKFCTENPEELNFPVKALFVIDSSGSMIDSDPVDKRADAVLQVIEKLNSNEEISFGIVMFSSLATMLTDNFTKDYDALSTAIANLRKEYSGTNYKDALSKVYSIIDNDISQLSEQKKSQTKYIVIFLSDGYPYGEGNSYPYNDIYDSEL